MANTITINPQTGKLDIVGGVLPDSSGIAAMLTAMLAANAGFSVTVTGPKVTGSSPPTKGPTTVARIAYYTNLGFPAANVLWNVVGEESA